MGRLGLGSCQTHRAEEIIVAGFTPDAPDHGGLGPLDSRFVRAAALPWRQAIFPGVHYKTLLMDKEAGLMTVLMKMDPGATLPDHEHTLVEQTYMLEGRLVDRDGECGPGDFVYRPAGSRHSATCPDGALMIAVFQLPNKFFMPDGSVQDFVGGDWEAKWAGTTGAKMLG
jgi:quercetin dioxygenase-like cupin family protein